MEKRNQQLFKARTSSKPKILLMFLVLGFAIIIAYTSFNRTAQQDDFAKNESTPSLSSGQTIIKALQNKQDGYSIPNLSDLLNGDVLSTPQIVNVKQEAESGSSSTFLQDINKYLALYEPDSKLMDFAETNDNKSDVTAAAPVPVPSDSKQAPAPAPVITNTNDAPDALEQAKIALQARRAEALLRALGSGSNVDTVGALGSAGSRSSAALAQGSSGSNGLNGLARGSQGLGSGANNMGAGSGTSPNAQAYLASARDELNALNAMKAASGNGLASGGSRNGLVGRGRTLSSYQELANNDTLLDTKMETVLSPFLLRQGVVIPCVLMTGINSDLPGLVQAQVTSNVYDTPYGDHILIPRGSKIVGQYGSSPALGQERLMMGFNRIIFPDGKAMNLGSMPGSALDGYAGFEADVNNHFFKLITNSILLGGVTAAINLSVDDKYDENGNLTVNSALAQGLGQSLGRTITAMIENNMNLSPTLQVEPGYNFNVTLIKDIYFDGPYIDHDYEYQMTNYR